MRALVLALYSNLLKHSFRKGIMDNISEALCIIILRNALDIQSATSRRVGVDCAPAPPL